MRRGRRGVCRLFSLFHNAFLQVFGEVHAHLGGGALGGDLCHVVIDHDLHQFLEGSGIGVPAEFGAGLRGVAPEVDDVGGAVEVGGDLDEGLADEVVGAANADALLVLGFALPLEFDADIVEGELGKLADAVLHARGDDVVLGLARLEDEPHTLDVVLGVAPVAEGVQVAEVEFVLQALGDAGGGEGDLTGDEGLATALALVVEEDAVAAEHAVGVAVLLDDPEAVLLGDGVGTEGMEGGVLVLGYFLDLAVELGGGGLVDLAAIGEAHLADGLDDAEDADGIDIGGELGGVEADLHVALGGEVVDLRGAHVGDDADNGHGVAEVGVVEVEVGAALKVGDALAVIDGGAADNAVDVIAFVEEEFGEVGAVLAGHARDEGNVLFAHNNRFWG